MGKPARKWVIGLSAMLAFLAIVALLDAVSTDIALPAQVIGVAAWAISLLRRQVALALFAPPVAVLLLMGINSQELARGVFVYMSFALGTALAAAVIGGWVFDRFLRKVPDGAA